MISTFDLFTLFIAPSVGSFLGTLMFATSVRAVLAQEKLVAGIGVLNPAPYPIVVSNCLGWILYGCTVKNQWIWWSNLPGLLMGIWLCFSASGLCLPSEEKIRRAILRSILLWIGFWASVAYVCVFLIPSHETVVTTLGVCACGVLCCLYGAPLSTLATVLRTRDSSSLYPPLVGIACFCSLLWTVYGLVIGDVFLWGPNCVGATLSLTQLALIAIFPRLSAAAAENSNQARTGDSKEDIKGTGFSVSSSARRIALVDDGSGL